MQVIKLLVIASSYKNVIDAFLRPVAYLYHTRNYKVDITMLACFIFFGLSEISQIETGETGETGTGTG